MKALRLLLLFSLPACVVEAPAPRVKVQAERSDLAPAATSPISGPTTPVAPAGKPKAEPAPTIPANCDMSSAPAWTPCAGNTFVADHPLIGWQHWTTSSWMLVDPNPHHRGVDAVMSTSSAQLLEAKFTYGTVHKDLVHEAIDVYVERSCGTWEFLGEASTTNDGDHGSDDDGGRVYFYVPESKKLALGDYRVKMVVKGDHTEANLWAHVWPEGTPLVVSDIDGTITTKEWDGLITFFDSNYPDPRDGTEELFSAYHAKGYRVVYLTARPEPMTGDTRDWFADHLFPEGVFHLSLTDIGEHGDNARAFKQAYLQTLVAKGFELKAVYGNKGTDLDAYLGAGAAPQNVTLVSGQYSGDLKGARMVDGWLQEAVNVGCSTPL